MAEKHIFALHCKDLSKNLGIKSNSFVEFTDKDLAHRILKILRLQKGETVTLFDSTINIDLEIADSKNRLCGNILRLEENRQIKPGITLFPSILKKDAFEDVIYAAAQMAVTRIIPVISAKAQRSWGQEKELERLTGIMVSACEQSKNFAVPELLRPIKVEDLPQTIKSHNLEINAYFDPSGQSFLSLLKEIDQSTNKNISLLFGPEGGLTPDEEKFVADAGFTTYALTPTILRSREAVIVGLGGVRSVARIQKSNR